MIDSDTRVSLLDVGLNLGFIEEELTFLIIDLLKNPCRKETLYKLEHLLEITTRLSGSVKELISKP